VFDYIKNHHLAIIEHINATATILDTGPGAGATATVVVSNGVVTAITVTSGGSGYVSPYIVISQSDAVDVIRAVVDSSTTIEKFKIINGGKGFAANSRLNLIIDPPSTTPEYIGTCRVKAIDFVSGIKYKLHMFDVLLNKGYKWDIHAKSVKSRTTNFSANVSEYYKELSGGVNITNEGDTITGNSAYFSKELEAGQTIIINGEYRNKIKGSVYSDSLAYVEKPWKLIARTLPVSSTIVNDVYTFTYSNNILVEKTAILTSDAIMITDNRGISYRVFSDTTNPLGDNITTNAVVFDAISSSLVLAGNAGNIAYSYDYGITWSPSSLIGGTNPNILSLAVSNILGTSSIVAGCVGGVLFQKLTSPEYTADAFVVGTSIADASISASIYRITYGDNKFVGCSDKGIIRSSNKQTWYVADSFVAKSIAYGNGKFIAMASSGAWKHSTDGITWTSGTSITGTTFTDIGSNWSFDAKKISTPVMNAPFFSFSSINDCANGSFNDWH